MPRQARVVAVDVPHHITHRGNNRQDVFLTDEDRRRYQDLLRNQLEPCGIELLGWCWMSNHVHLVAVPRRENSLSRLVMQVHSAYAQDFNRRYRRSGHLWHSRFYSCALGPAHLYAALLYVNRNPVRAGMTGEATAWRWSSATAHVDGVDPDGLLAAWMLDSIGGFENWRECLSQPLDQDASAELREATRSGRPFGHSEFLEQLENQAGRRLRPAPMGRPRKSTARSAAAGSDSG